VEQVQVVHQLVEYVAAAALVKQQRHKIQETCSLGHGVTLINTKAHRKLVD
jgi:hypothetical protein